MTGHGTILITGGTGGLGRQAARAVAEADPGAHVVLTGRDAGAADAVARELRGRTKAEVTGLPLDLGSLAEVRAFAERLVALGLPPFTGLICNAGIQNATAARRSEDGYELTFAVNHLAHFALVGHLLPHLDASARIVVVASDTHDPAKPTGMPAPGYTTADELARPGDDTALEGRRRYTASKLCNVLMAYELARRLGEGGTGITVNAFDPGLMPGTGLARDYGGVQAFAWRYVMPVLVVVPGLNAHTTRRSGRALGRLITAPEHAGTTGAYLSGFRRIPSSEDSYDAAKAADLWRTSERLVAAHATESPAPPEYLTGGDGRNAGG